MDLICLVNCGATLIRCAYINYMGKSVPDFSGSSGFFYSPKIDLAKSPRTVEKIGDWGGGVVCVCVCGGGGVDSQ